MSHEFIASPLLSSSHSKEGGTNRADLISMQPLISKCNAGLNSDADEKKGDDDVESAECDGLPDLWTIDSLAHSDFMIRVLDNDEGRYGKPNACMEAEMAKVLWRIVRPIQPKSSCSTEKLE